MARWMIEMRQLSDELSGKRWIYSGLGYHHLMHQASA